MSFENKDSIYSSLLIHNPCIYCAKKNLPVNINKETKKCSGCGYSHYCCVEHQKEDWKKHKSFCKSMTFERHFQLERFFKEAFLFTDGERWYSIPVCASKELKELYFLSEKIEKLAHIAAEKGKVFNYKTPFCITPYMTKLIKASEKAEDPKQRFSYSLQSDYSCFHEQIYGLNHPRQIITIIDFLKNKKITKLVDPLARTGITTAMFNAFSENYFQIKISDIKPEHDSVSKINALDAIAYENVNFNESVVIISWPDTGGREPLNKFFDIENGDGLSVFLIPFLHEIGAKYLLVMYEDYKIDELTTMECAFCLTGKKILDKLYKKINIPGVEAFVILKEKTQHNYGGYLDKIINELVSKGVGQSTYFYERR